MDEKAPQKILFLDGWFISAIAMATLIESNNVELLINQRLSYMKDIAGYKARNYLAIEDLPQEEKVLSSTVSEADKLGLDGESVKPFIQAQMDAAKTIQYRNRADGLLLPGNIGNRNN